MLLALSFAFVAGVYGKVYFKETFGDDYTSRWTVSNWRKDDGTAGDWVHSAGNFYGDAEEDKGIMTSPDARFFAISAPLTEAFDNKGKDLVLQFSVKHQQTIDCGGGYIKLFPAGHPSENFSGDSPYNIMFGPDICGSSTKKVHVIFNYKGENKLTNKATSCESDAFSHVYTLIVHPDQTYEVRIDGTQKASGNLVDDWDFLPPKMIKDPALSKPSDWVDEAMIDDPEDVKPEGYDNIPKTIPDPEAAKPEDWDDADDGEWEAPVIDNPEYKGPWTAKRIENPAYKGAWVHPEIDNPDYKHDDSIYHSNSAFVGFDLWQVKSGSIFDNIIVTDDIAEAEAFLAATYSKNIEAEKKMHEEQEQKKRDEAEAARKAAEEEKKTEVDEDEDESEGEKEDL
jgi:calreticulin